MHRIVLACAVPVSTGEEAASDIVREFVEFRQHYSDPSCIFEDGKLVLACTTDWDADGSNLIDEFSDCICAYVVAGFDSDIEIRSIMQI